MPHTPEHTPFGFTAPTIPEQITGDTLTPSQPLAVETSQPAPLPNVQAIDTEIKAPEIPEQNDLTTQLESTISRLEGRESEEQSRLETATIAQERELNEINKQIRLLQAEELKATEEARERGETLGFAAGESARVRRNFAIEAIRLSALAEAKQGNVVFAQRQAKRAIDTEFAQVERDAQIARQNILANYDNLTTAEKKRADAALLRLNEQDQFVAEQKAQRRSVQDIAIQAALAQAPNTVLEQIRNAPDAIEAARLAAPYLQKIEESKSFFTPQQVFQNEQRLIDKFNSDDRIKDFRDINNRFDILNRALQEAQTTDNFVAVDQAIISAFNKITDPSSVVRESEYARTADDLSLVNRLRGKVQKVQTGGAGLTQDDREAIVRLAEQFREVAFEKAQQAQFEVNEQAQRFGLTPTFGSDLQKTQERTILVDDDEAEQLIRQEESAGESGSLFGNFLRGLREAFGG